jgi:hypothetical protein
VRSRARIDRQVRKVLPHRLGHPERVLDIIDGKHEGGRLVGLSGTQDIDPSGVAVIDLSPEPLHEIHLLDIRIERGEGNLAGAQHARDDLTEASQARNDDMSVGAGWHIIVRRFRGGAAANHFVGEQQHRRGGHRQRHCERE